MTSLRDDLVPAAPDEDFELGARLERERPLPAPAFRGALRRQLLAQAAPRGLKMRIAAFAGSGGALLVLAAMSAS